MTTFLQVADNARAIAPVDSLANLTQIVVLTGFDTTRLPSLTTGYIVTIWDAAQYPDPTDDPNMEKAFVTAATIGVSGSLTLNRTAAKSHEGRPMIALLAISRHIQDGYTAINNLETVVATKYDASNPAGYITAAQVPAAPVQSVNGKTGVVVVNKGDVGLGNVDNTSDANKPVSTATQTALNTKEPLIAIGTSAQYIRGDKTLATLDKIAVGLANVDNTSDANKPISIATQTALDTKADTASVSGKVDRSGDTMTGTLNTLDLIPTTNLTRSVGSSALFYDNMYSRRHYFNSVSFMTGENASGTIDVTGRTVFTPVGNGDTIQINGQASGGTTFRLNGSTAVAAAIFDTNSVGAVGVLVRNQSTVRNGSGSASVFVVQNLDTVGVGGASAFIQQNATGSGLVILHTNNHVALDVQKTLTNKSNTSNTELIKSVRVNIFNDGASYVASGNLHLFRNSNPTLTNGSTVTDSYRVVNIEQLNPAGTGTALYADQRGTGYAAQFAGGDITIETARAIHFQSTSASWVIGRNILSPAVQTITTNRLQFQATTNSNEGFQWLGNSNAPLMELGNPSVISGLNLVLYTNFVPDTNQANDIGNTTRYWNNSYISKQWFNSTSAIDGTTQTGYATLTGRIQSSSATGHRFGRLTSIGDETVVFTRTAGEGDYTIAGGTVAIFQSNSASNTTARVSILSGSLATAQLAFSNYLNATAGTLNFNHTNYQFALNKSITISGGLTVNGIFTTTVGTVSSLTVTPQGTTGTTTITYGVTARTVTGETPVRTTTVSTSNAVLDSTNFNTLTWPATSGAKDYRIWRTVTTSTNATTTGVIGVVSDGSANPLSFNDTGIAADGSTAPTANSTHFLGVGVSQPGEAGEFNSGNATIRIKNTGDALGTFIGESFATLQLGLYNPTGSTVNGIVAGTKRTYFAIGPDGRVGSVSTLFGNPTYRNLLDDGTGIVKISTLAGGGVQMVVADNDGQLGMQPIPSGGGAVAWGSITGTLSSQTDLNTALNAKVLQSTSTNTAEVYSRLNGVETVTLFSSLAGNNTLARRTASGQITANDATVSTNVTTKGQVDTALALKQDLLILTTTGTSGAASLVGNTLNIPQYSGGGGGGSGITRSVVNTAGAYTVAAVALTDYVYLVTGAHAGTMPTAANNTNRYTIKNKHTASVTLTRAGSDTFFVDGTTTTVIDLAPGDSVDLISNGTAEWSVL